MARSWVVILAFLAGCRSLENGLVFHPTPGDPQAAAPLPAPLQDVTLQTADGVKIHARWCPHPRAKGALIYCPGNAGNLEMRAKVMRDFWDSLERSVLIFDYPGYGRSEGKPSEDGCYAAAEAAFAWLTRECRIAPEQIVVAGESLGGGVAVDLASKKPHEALVLIRTFTSVPDVAARQFILASAPGVMGNRFDSLKKIGSCRSPVFIAQADRDEVMPFAHAEKLRAACPGPAHLYVLRGLRHNDALPPDFFRALRAFLDNATN